MVDRPLGAGLDHECLDAVESPLDAVLVRRAARPAHEREHAAAGIEQREIRLRIATVDREQERAHVRSRHRQSRRLRSCFCSSVGKADASASGSVKPTLVMSSVEPTLMRLAPR